MKLANAVMTAAVTLSLPFTALGDKYNDLAAQGYRWVTVDGPYACTTEQNLKGIVAHHTDATELEVVENIRCYYLIPGTIVQVIKEDKAYSMSEIQLGSVTRSLWTYTRFLSKRPVQDTYGITQMPENSGLSPKANTAVISRSWDSSTPEF